MLENCQPDSEKGITYTTISKWPKLAEVVTYLSSQSNALLRLCIMMSIEINANFSVASKKLPVTLWKAEIIVFILHHLNHLTHKLNCVQSRVGTYHQKKKWIQKANRQVHRGLTWWCPQVVSLPWWLLQTGKVLKGMIIWFPALWSKYSLLVITRYRDRVRQTLLATSRGSKLPCVHMLL